MLRYSMLLILQNFINKHFPNEKHKQAFKMSFIFYTTSSISISLAAKTTGFWMFDAGYKISSIAFFTSIMHLPYSSLRFLVAPWLDYLPIPSINIPSIGKFGYRKSFILITIIYNAISIAALGFVTPGNIYAFGAIAFGCAISSAILESLISAYFNNIYDEEYNPSWA